MLFTYLILENTYMHTAKYFFCPEYVLASICQFAKECTLSLTFIK